MRRDGEDRDDGLTSLIGAVAPEDPPCGRPVILYVGVPDLDIPVDREALVGMRRQAGMTRVLLQAAEGTAYLLQLGLLIAVTML